jgi:hypothetical protein
VGTDTSTLLSGQVSWNVAWQPGTATAECLNALGVVAQDASGNPVVDTLTTAGTPDHLVLQDVPDVVRPDGTSSQVTANGSDAAFVTAKVADANGVVAPGAINVICLSVCRELHERRRMVPRCSSLVCTAGPRRAITKQPASVAVNSGSVATLTVTATAAGPLTYQWSLDGNSLAGGDVGELYDADADQWRQR